MDPIERVLRVRERPERLAVGLMSGMSMDGLDVALVRLRDRGEGKDAVLVAFESLPYEPALVARIRAAVTGTTRGVARLHVELAERWAADVLAVLGRARVRPEHVDFLASHGQTVHHESRVATLQVGDGCVLAERTGLLTVSDFRARDVAAGGEGAPLIPLADWLLWSRPGETTACHNLGSIANVTVVTERREDVLAFDTGPANALIDAFARRVRGSGGIDRDGAVSASGKVLDPVLATLDAAAGAFLARPPPKSAGFDDFGPSLAERVAAAHPRARAKDLVRTAVEWTARTVADAYGRFVLPRHPRLKLVRFSGGGTRNRTTMERLRALLAPLGLQVEAFDDLASKAKEAVGFAILGDETLRGRPGNLPSATGARRPVVLGKISP